MSTFLGSTAFYFNGRLDKRLVSCPEMTPTSKALQTLTQDLEIIPLRHQIPHHLQAIASFMCAMLKASPIMVVGYGRVSWSTPWNHPLVQGRPRHNSTSSNLRSWMMIITYQSLTNQYHPIAHSSQPNGLFQQGNSQKECRPFNWCLILQKKGSKHSTTLVNNKHPAD